MDVNKEIRTASERAIKRVTLLGMAVNVLLAAIKLVAGYILGSLALIADGWHSLSDLVSDVFVLLGASLAGRPPDKNHPFGHGKFETFAAWFVAAILFFVGGMIVFQGAENLLRAAHPSRSLFIIIAALLSIFTKEWLYQITIRVARTHHSEMVKANAWHHRSDAFSSVVVLFGGLSAAMGWQYGDALAGALVGLMIIIVAWRIGLDAVRELSEMSAGSEIEELVESIIASHQEVRGWHRLRIRRLGRELAMDIHLLLDANISIKEGHDIVVRIEQALVDKIDWPIHATIHIDPDTDEIRRSSSRLDGAVVR